LESVIPKEVYPSVGASEEKRREAFRYLYREYGAGPAERLSGVDLLKRKGVTAFALDDGQEDVPADESASKHKGAMGFPSTSHMATLTFLERLQQVLEGQHLEQVKQAWDTYIEQVRSHAFSQQLECVPQSYPAHPLLEHYEGSMLFEERLVDVLYQPGAV